MIKQRGSTVSHLWTGVVQIFFFLVNTLEWGVLRKFFGTIICSRNKMNLKFGYFLNGICVWAWRVKIGVLKNLEVQLSSRASSRRNQIIEINSLLWIPPFEVVGDIIVYYQHLSWIWMSWRGWNPSFVTAQTEALKWNYLLMRVK